MPKESTLAPEDGDGFHEVHVNTSGRFLVSLALVVRLIAAFHKKTAALFEQLYRSSTMPEGKALLSALLECHSHLAPWNPYWR